MSRDEVSQTAEEMDRREFFRHVGVGGVAGSLVSSAQGQTASSQTQSADISAQYPGAHYFVGPWRLRIDRDNVGKTQKWHLKEPSDAIAPAAAVMVPSCWQEYVPEFSGGVGWYFKEFTLPAALKDRVMRLKFWAVDYFAEVWINGRPVGSHEGGFTPFEFDITAQAKFGGENHLVVRVVDPPRPLEQSLLGLPGWEGTSDGTADGFKFREIPMGPQSWQEGLNFGGIWQAVELLETSLLHVSDVFVEPKLAENAIEVHVEVNNKELKGVSGTIRVVVRPWKELTVAGQGERAESLVPGLQVANVRVAIEHPRPWTPDDPYLYVAEVSVQEGGIVRHSTSARFGLREFSVRDGFFQLNGKRIFIKGGHHQGTYPTKLVFPPSREFAYKEVQIFKEAGFNFCRLWVKPAPPAFLDAADELGLMVQEEPPFSIMEDSPFMLERSLREVREMVKRDRNRPSIVVWNMINEADPAMKYVREQCSAARELDPSRLITETAGGPTHYYVPYSNVGVSYLDEHPYPGAPLADDVYEYNRTRGVVGQLTFFSEYGYGGMNDIESVLAHYGEHPKRHMEDYSGHVRLKQIRDSAFEQSDALKRIFGSMEKLREACQTVQADAVRLQTEAMRCNPATGGYNYVQVFDSNAFEIDGLVDFWRDKRKKAFYAMQDANKPLLLVIRCSRMNARSDEDFELQVMMVNEERVTGPRRLTVRIQSPSGTEVFRKEITVEVKPWISTLFQETVNVKGESGRYPVEAALWDQSTPIVHKEEFCTIFAQEDLKWQGSLVVFDPDQQLQPFLEERSAPYRKPDSDIGGQPAVIVITPSTALWRRPEEFRTFFRLLTWVSRGCTGLFLDVPVDGPCPLTAAQFFMESFLSPCSVAHVTPFDRIESTDEVWAGQRVGAYSWGLTDHMAGMSIPVHPVFDGIPHTGLMGREWGNVVPVKKIRTDWRTVEDTGSAVQIFSSSSLTRIGTGKIIISSLNLLPNLRRDALAEKLLCNLVNYAHSSLPHALDAEDRYTVESLKFQSEDYLDCITKYLLK